MNKTGLMALSTLSFWGLLALQAPAEEFKPKTFINTPYQNTFDYNYVEGNLVITDDLGNGIEFKGSYDLKPNLAVIGGFQYTGKDKADFTTVSGGLAYHRQIAKDDIPNLDLIIHAELEQHFADYAYGDDSDFGIRVGTGVRYLLQPKLETFGDFSLSTTGSTAVFLTGGARYYFFDNLAAVGRITFSDTNSIALGVHYRF